MKGRGEASLHAGTVLVSGLLHLFLLASLFFLQPAGRKVSFHSFQVSLIGSVPTLPTPPQPEEVEDEPLAPKPSAATFAPRAPAPPSSATFAPRAPAPPSSPASPGSSSMPRPTFRQWWEGVGIVNVPSARRAPKDGMQKGPITGGVAEWWKQQRSSPNPQTIARESAKQGGERTPPAQSSSIGRSAIASATGIPPTYLSLIERKVSEQWELPPLSNELASVVLFVLTPAGEVMSPIVEESSGNPFFDQSALRAVVGTRLPPFPPGIEPHPLKVHFRFSIVRPS